MGYDTNYFMPMDREYINTDPHSGHNHGGHSHATNDVGVGMGDFGMSLGLGPVPNVHSIGAKLRAGTKTMEFVFMGAGKGSGQGHTPESYGLKQRAALVEMGRANKVDFTTHATVGVMGLAGMDQGGSFSKQSKNASLNEIKRAVEFASDVAMGGPIVVHTGEFQRPLVDADWNQQNDGWQGKFEMFADEDERATFRVVDSRSGRLIDEARKNRKVYKPQWNRYDKDTAEWDEHGGQSYTDENGKIVKPGDYVDYFGNRINSELRVPKFDKEQQRFLTKEMGWPELQAEAKEMTARAREVWNDYRNGKISQKEFTQSNWARFVNAESEKEVIIRPEEAYIIQTLETNAANARGYAQYYGGSFDEHIDTLKKLKKALEIYKKIEDATDEEEKWKLKQQVAGSSLGGLIPPDEQFPTEAIKKAIQQQERSIAYSKDSSAAQWAQAAEAQDTIRHVQSAETYALSEAYDSYARAAMGAMRHSDKLEKQGKLKAPLFMALENLFPESYGAHPDELMKMVDGSRKRMQELLMQQGMSKEQAVKESIEHLNTTMDLGHLNMWRKYWKGDPHKSLAENDKDFDDWMIDKLGEMTRRQMIGHVHVDDNYGYQDDHLAPGEGNAPIKRMIETMKKNGYKGELIVEPGADYYNDNSGFHSVMKTWRLFGSPVYGASSGLGPRGQARNWNQVGYGWFGQSQPAYFTFGGYSPSEDWTLWSGVPLE